MAIKVEQLVKKFGNFVAVDHISFDVKDGEIFAFLGPNGAGKSTTIKMLTTLLKPTSGEISVNGFNWHLLISTSTGISMSTGPGRPVFAM